MKKTRLLLELLTKNQPLTFSKIKIHGDGQRQLTITDPGQPEGKQQRQGQYFISLTQALIGVLPGNVLSACQFLEALAVDDNKHLIEKKLTGFYIGDQQNPILNYKNKCLQLRIFHGSTNPKALEISRLAEAGFADQQIRADYQEKVYDLVKPLLAFSSKASLYIVEDCLASGETIVGLITLLAKKRGLAVKQVRVDVVSATTQGILVLKKFVSDNDIKLELNIGYLAYGLSKGQIIGDSCQHANYLIYPEDFKKKFNFSYEYVVGDMGDAAKSMSKKYDDQYPWNRFRNDPHGERGYKSEGKSKLKPVKPIIIYLSNGGYLMRSLVKLIRPKLNFQELILSAKRVWSTEEKYGYGVLIKENL